MIGAVLTIGTGLIVTHARTIWDGIERLFEGSRPYSEQRIDNWVADARTAPFWAAAPMIYQPSVAYLRTHFAEFDPRRDHKEAPTGPRMDLALLGVGAPLFEGQPVVVSGRIVDERVVSRANPFRGFHDWQIQLEDASKAPDNQGFAYCRTSVSSRLPLPPPRALMAVGGVVVASGYTRANVPALYLICPTWEPIIILGPHRHPSMFGTLP